MQEKRSVSSILEHREEKIPDNIDELCINTIRFLSVDAVQKANSGHPGLPLDAAAMGYVLWNQFMRYNPKNPLWFNRDRFLLSAGHGSMLLYSLLYLTGYDLSLDQIKQFRQWGSQTPGHPERGHTLGVEVTTGPLGQGFGNGVGMAIAEANLAARYNRPGYPIVNHFTYSICSDGDLMEGVASEAASLAGHLKLGKLVYFYDDNHVTLSAGTDVAFTEDVGMRFQAYGWQVLRVPDGNMVSALSSALQSARQDHERPTLIIVRTHLGYGSPNKQDTYEAHGNPLGEDEVRLTKENLGWPTEPPFYIPDAALAHFRQAIERGEQAESEWNSLFEGYAREYPDLAAEFQRLVKNELLPDWDTDLPTFASKDGKLATRIAVGKAMNASAGRLPALVGGSADLDPSTFTQLKNLGDFESPDLQYPDRQDMSGGDLNYAGRNIHFGVREHAMGTILNGIATHGGLLPFGATFLIFSDYMRPPMRLASLMKAHVLFIFTHDSIALGEDGPTHQPVEQLVGLRAVPNNLVIRPADANETVAAWKVAVEHQNGPVCLILTRQKLPVLDVDQYPQLGEGVPRGGYILADAPQGQPQIALVASGSEVSLALEAREQLAKEGIQARVVSFPSWQLWQDQPQDYRDQVLPLELPVLSIEAGATLGWMPYLKRENFHAIGVDSFGASAPMDKLLEEYGFTVENVITHVREVLKK
jgi:transketolase